MYYILKLECSEVMQIIVIICLFLTVYSQYFSKVFLEMSMVGLPYYNIYQNLPKIVLNIKFHISVLLTITTFLLKSLLSS